MHEIKVNKDLYEKMKAAILGSDYTVEEVLVTLQWIRWELVNKQGGIINAIKVNDVDSQQDHYHEQHKFEDGPYREDCEPENGLATPKWDCQAGRTTR